MARDDESRSRTRPREGHRPAWLVPLDGAQRGVLFRLGPHVLIGTDPECQVRLAHHSISRRHAEVYRDGERGYRFRDLGSTNGTFKNDGRCDSGELVDNDHLRVGLINLCFKGGH